MFLSDCLDLLDPVFTFDRFMEGIDIQKYLRKVPRHKTGRLRYNPVNMLKTVLFGFMTRGYCSLRELEDNCKVNLRFMYLMDRERPSYRTFGYFINEILSESVEEIFADINRAIFEEEHVDLQHIYIDGSKFEANANKYSWVWKKATEKSRYRLYKKITELIKIINEELAWSGTKISTNTEYVPEYLDEVAEQYAMLWQLDEKTFMHGKGKHKTIQQRHYEWLRQYADKLREYVEKINICGPERNSYSKTDHSATFMRVKTDYMGNDQLLPAYNMQIGVCDEYIAVVDAQQYASDMDCFVPLLKKFRNAYGEYPMYPVGDAGYGSYNNYLFCEQNGIGKYMKFTMYDKESKDPKFRDDPYRAVNFKRDENGRLMCPEGRIFEFLGNKPVRGNKYGRTEELYKCSSCEGCPNRGKCCHGDGDRTIRMNRELTAIHREVLENLQTELGTRLRTNRTIQAEGAFGSIKWNRAYKRARRRGIESVILEFTLISIGFNLYKFHNKKLRVALAA